MSRAPLHRCLRCGHYHFAGELICIYCHFTVTPWTVTPRRRSTPTTPTHYDVLREGKLRRVVTQK